MKKGKKPRMPSRAGLLLARLPAPRWLYPLYLSRQLYLKEDMLCLPALPEALDGLRIAYASDIHYGAYLGRERLTQLADRLNISKVWYMTLLFSGCILLINLLARPLKYETLQVNRIGTVMIGLLFVLLIIWVVMNTVFYFIVIEMMKAAEEEQELKILRLQEEQYRSQLDYIRQSARTRHDFRQTLRTLNNMARADRAEDICSFLSDYMNDLPENETVIYCKNSAVNAILNHYAVQAKQKGIAVRLDIDDVGEQGMLSDAELCTMLGNLLENAVDACGAAEENRNFIQLTVSVRENKWLYIVETNSFDGKARMRNGKYVSAKTGGGTGLWSIASTARRYGGRAEFSHDRNTFYANIAIPLQKKS